MKAIKKKAAKKSQGEHPKARELHTEPPISEKDEVKQAEQRMRKKTSPDNS